PAPERGLALSVDIQYLQLPGGVPQEGKPRRTQPPSSLRLIERSGETWKLNRDAIW
ncbi:MAG: hypothetical protein HY814_08675, partial [Candidatus Riflebacteria bacterium]|nr:hypothetical protein [Candidatus Riflebacteria bacterium]